MNNIDRNLRRAEEATSRGSCIRALQYITEASRLEGSLEEHDPQWHKSDASSVVLDNRPHNLTDRITRGFNVVAGSCLVLKRGR